MVVPPHHNEKTVNFYYSIWSPTPLSIQQKNIEGELTSSLGGAVFTHRDTERQTNDKERVAVFFLNKIRQQKIVVIFLDFDNLKDVDDIFILSHLKIKLKMTELIWPLYLLTVISNYNEILREMEYGYYIESYSRIFSYRINALRI